MRDAAALGVKVHPASSAPNPSDLFSHSLRFSKTHPVLVAANQACGGVGTVQLIFLTSSRRSTIVAGYPEDLDVLRGERTYLRHFFQTLWLKWTLVILPVLIKWGILGAGAIAVLDSSTIPVPMDALIAVWVWKDQGHFWAYCLMAAFGSAIGGLLPYGLGRAGGELFILKRVNRERYERIKLRFEKQEFLAMAIPSALPPPTPWKAFVFAAGVFEMRVLPFMLAVFTGRMVRWLVLSLLVIKLGPGALGIVQHHSLAGLLLVLGLAVIGFGIWWMRKRRSGEISLTE
jgi:membrane protein YqaA with SNARE-associated domain